MEVVITHINEFASKRKKTTTQQTKKNINEKKVNHFDR